MLVERRKFLKKALITSFVFGALPSLDLFSLLNSAEAKSIIKASRIVKGKSPELIVHNAKVGVMETPLYLLRKYYITPKEILYVRNHFPVKELGFDVLSPVIDDGWTINIGGLVGRPGKITVGELKKMKTVKVTCVLQCSGNGRAFYAKKAKTPGSQWKHGGMGNVVWKGVKLKDVFKALAVEIDPSARFITANGKDKPITPIGSDFVHSMPLHDVLDKAILAIEMNGEPIPAIHGGPVRLIIPGYYGTMQIKWLTDIYITDKESPSRFQKKAYRIPVSPVEPGEMTPLDFNQFNSIPNYRMKVKTVIFYPMNGERVKSGFFKVKGVSWNDGLVPINEIYISTDKGKDWIRAHVVRNDGLYAWYLWEAEIKLKRGQKFIWARAIDEWGRGQPLNGVDRWNPKGYEWNGVDKVTVEVI